MSIWFYWLSISINPHLRTYVQPSPLSSRTSVLPSVASVPALVPHLCVFSAAGLRSTSAMDFSSRSTILFVTCFLPCYAFLTSLFTFVFLAFSLFIGCIYSVPLSFLVHLLSLSLTWRSPKGETLSFFRSLSSFFRLSLMLCQNASTDYQCWFFEEYCRIQW